MPGCYCVIRIRLTIPQQHDSHVMAYDIHYIRELRIKAKKAGRHELAYAIKAGVNAYMLPFAEMRRAFQSMDLGL